MAGIPCVLRLGDLERIPAWCAEHPLRYRRQSGQLHIQCQGFRHGCGGISEILSANFTKAEGLAFIFAISFNMPCVSALAATARETHSVKWTAKIGMFYTLAVLLIACIVDHVGLLMF